MEEDLIRGLYKTALRKMKDRYGLAAEPRLLCVSDAAAFNAALRELGKGACINVHKIGLDNMRPNAYNNSVG